MDTVLLDSFYSQDTFETRRHYGRDLKEVVLFRTSFYTNSAMIAGGIAAELGEELSVPGPWTFEIGPMFESMENRTHKLLKLIDVT